MVDWHNEGSLLRWKNNTVKELQGGWRSREYIFLVLK